MSRGISFGLRVIACALVFVAPFLPPFPVHVDEITIVMVADRSASVPAADQERMDAFIEEVRDARGDAHFGWVDFDGQAHVRVWPGFEQVHELEQAQFGSDVAGAVRLGAALLETPGRRRLVLLTDGRPTTTGTEQAIERARARGIEVDLVTMGGGDPNEIHLVRVETSQERVTRGEPVEVSARVQGPPNTEASVLFSRDGEALGTVNVRFDADSEATARFTDAEPPTGIHVYAASVSNHSERRVVTVQGNARVLLVTLLPDQNPPLINRALSGAAEIDTWALQMGDIPEERLRDADLVVLVDMPLARPGASTQFLSGLSRTTQERLVDYVGQEGGGLLVSGGAFGFGPDWSGQPLARLLPVTIEDEGRVEDPPIALAMMLDASGSMGARVGSYSKIRLAVEGCLAAVDALRPDDQAAIGATETTTRWIQRLAPTSEVLRNRSSIRRLRAGGGGIYVYTALRDAYRELASATQPIRHVILFSDTGDSEEQSDGCPFSCSGPGPHQPAVEFAREARAAGITTTVVGIGAASARDTTFLTQLAAAGGGRFYLTETGSDLRRIFVTETRAVAHTNLREELTPLRRGDPSPMLEGIGEIPSIAGFVQSHRRPTADTALLSTDGHPLLASWRYGLGTVVAFTSDVGGRWSRSWNEWEQAPQLFRQMVRYGRRRAHGGADLEANLDGRAGSITIDLAEEAELDGDRLSVRALSGSGQWTDIDTTIERVGPTRYRATFRTDGQPVIMANLRDEGGRMIAQTDAQDRATEEHAGAGPDERALRQWARLGGGELVQDAQRVLRPIGASVPRPEPSWPWLLLFAAVLIAIDLFIRRLGRPRLAADVLGLPPRMPLLSERSVPRPNHPEAVNEEHRGAA